MVRIFTSVYAIPLLVGYFCPKDSVLLPLLLENFANNEWLDRLLPE